jgi:hypothetical protein
MKRALGFALLVVALSTTSTGCTKNKKRADKLEAELSRCRAAVQQLESGQLTIEQQAEFASLDCGDWSEGGVQ